MLEICIGQIGETSGPERLIAWLGILVVCGCGLYALARWLGRGSPSPDPWDDATATEIAEGDCTPLCHHCLTPHDPAADFCAQCGAAVGACTNLLPFPYVFSIGHGLRIGTHEHFKRSPLTIVGFFFFSAAEFGPLAPVYWFRLIQNLRRPPEPPEPPAEDAPGSNPG